MGFTCGIVGLPNVGKSTIFNALTSAKAAAANFPFCTIEPNTGAVPVPDPRLAVLAAIAKSDKIIPAQVTFVDIAGLIRGASKGEGLGNQFLGHIRSVDAIVHVLRCFTNDDVVHVEGEVNPTRDFDTIETELIFADYEAVQRAVQKAEKSAKTGDKEARATVEVLRGLEQHLGSGKPAKTWHSEQDLETVTTVVTNLLSAKPALILANVNEDDCATTPSKAGDRPVDKVATLAESRNMPMVVISGGIEAEIAELPPAERADYLGSLGLETSGLERLAKAGYELLSLLTFFTVGPKETHAWTAPLGSKAPTCAGKIHSDFERGFIRAEVIGYDDFVAAGSEAKAREMGKLRVEGKDYTMQDGDIVHFRFNV